MDQRKLTCVCGQQFSEEEFSRHYCTCQPFKQQFKEFDSKFGELLKQYSEPKEKLLIVKFLLKQYINVIDKKLKKYFAGLNQNQNPPPQGISGNDAPPLGGYGAPPGMNNNMDNAMNMNKDNNLYNNIKRPNDNENIQNSFPNQNSNNNPYRNPINNPYKNPNNNPYQNLNNNPYQNPNNNPYQNPSNNPYQNPNKNPYNDPYKDIMKENNKDNSNPFGQPENKEKDNNDFAEDFNPQPIQQEDSNSALCQKCKVNPDIIYLPCVHPICKSCFIKSAEENFYDMKCEICRKMVEDQDKRMILGAEKMAELENKALMMLVGNLTKCPNCGEQNAFEEGNVDYNVRDDQGQRLSRQAAEDYAKHRCRCGFCKKDFCINPECKSIPYHLGKTCEEFKRYEKAKKCRFCDSEIKLNNRGPDDDVCNDDDCKQRYMIACKKVLGCGHKCFGVNGERKCPPCIDKECQQFHGNFGQCKDDYCPICFTEGLGSSPMVELSCGHYIHYICVKKRLETKWIGPKITFNHCLCPSCNKWFDCYSVPDLQKMIDENKKLFEEIKEMSLKRLKFENLDKDPRLTDPNSPWFGKTVEFALKRLSYYMCYVCKKPYFAGRRECGNDPNMNNDDPNKNYDPKDCVCGKDANLAGVAGKTNCPKHGKDYIEYKCKFCCKIASWFCWGTTHFCEDCHKRQCNNDYVSKYPKERLPKCNKATCEVGGNHPPNGEEFALGCSICRNFAENDNKQF